MAASTSTGPVTELVTLALNGESYEGQDTLLSQYPPQNPPSASYWGLQHEDQAKLHWVISTPTPNTIIRKANNLCTSTGVNFQTTPTS